MAAFHRELDDKELDDYMIEYHPYYSGRNPNHHTEGSDSQTLVYLKSGQLQKRDPDRFYAFCKRIKKWLLTFIRSVQTGNSSSIVVSIAPGHKENSPPNFLPGGTGDFVPQQYSVHGTLCAL